MSRQYQNLNEATKIRLRWTFVFGQAETKKRMRNLLARAKHSNAKNVGSFIVPKMSILTRNEVSPTLNPEDQEASHNVTKKNTNTDMTCNELNPESIVLYYFMHFSYIYNSDAAKEKYIERKLIGIVSPDV